MNLEQWLYATLGPELAMFLLMGARPGNEPGALHAGREDC